MYALPNMPNAFIEDSVEKEDGIKYADILRKQYDNCFWIRNMIHKGGWEIRIIYDEKNEGCASLKHYSKIMYINLAFQLEHISTVLYRISLIYLRKYLGYEYLLAYYSYQAETQLELDIKMQISRNMYLEMLEELDFSKNTHDLSSYKEFEGYKDIYKIAKGEDIKVEQIEFKHFEIEKNSSHICTLMHIDKFLEEIEILPENVQKYIFDTIGYKIVIDIRLENIVNEDMKIYVDYIEKKILIRNFGLEVFSLSEVIVNLYVRLKFSNKQKAKMHYLFFITNAKKLNEVLEYTGIDLEYLKEWGCFAVFSVIAVNMLINPEVIEDKIPKFATFIKKTIIEEV